MILLSRKFTPLDIYYIAGELCCIFTLVDKLPISQGLLSNGGTAKIAKVNNQLSISSLR